MSPVTAAIISALIGAALVICGVYLLLGTGWAVLSGAPLFFAFTALLLKGLKRE